MLRSISVGMAVFINILIICLWHFLSYLVTKFFPKKFIDYSKFPFRAYGYENRGDFYTENFNIQYWYRLLPTRFNFEDINAVKIANADIPTLKGYILYTCRSEMCSLINCLYALFSVIINIPYLGFISGVIVIFINLPFIFANRYVRLLLLNEFVKKRKMQEIDEYIKQNNKGKNEKKYNLDSFS